MLDSNNYHEHRSLVSYSVLKEFIKCPKKGREVMKGARRVPTPAMLYGTYVHERFLEPNKYSRTKVYTPIGMLRTTIAGKKWTSEQRREKKDILSLNDYRSIEALYANSKSVGNINDIYLSPSGEIEKPITHTINGVDCKAKPDKIIRTGNKVKIIDLKTIKEDGNPNSEIYSYQRRYDLQAVFYTKMLSLAEGIDLSDIEFHFLFIEKPLGLPRVRIFPPSTSQEFQSVNEEITSALDRIKKCLKLEKWDGYDSLPEVCFSPFLKNSPSIDEDLL